MSIVESLKAHLHRKTTESTAGDDSNCGPQVLLLSRNFVKVNSIVSKLQKGIRNEQSN